jgi:hypothetical protein
VKKAALEPDSGAMGQAASLLRRAAKDTVDVQPRHAAVALAGWDALTCTTDPLGTADRRRVFLALSQALLSQFISTEQEMEILDQMDDAGLDRVPPFENTAVADLIRD